MILHKRRVRGRLHALVVWCGVTCVCEVFMCVCVQLFVFFLQILVYM